MTMMTDINPIAAETCAKTAAQNKVPFQDVVVMDLETAMVKGKMDVLIFNPPYVDTPSEEIESSLIARSWAGGKDGREVLDRLLPKVSDLLSGGGAFYLIAIKENRPNEICKALVASGMYSASVIAARKAKNEELVVIKALKSPQVNK